MFFILALGVLVFYFMLGFASSSVSVVSISSTSETANHSNISSHSI